MDPNLQPGPVMDALREQIRAVLRVRGFNFCDEGDGSPESNARAVADMRSAAGSVEGRDEVIAAGIEASTVDHQDQCIGAAPQPHAVVAACSARRRVCMQRDCLDMCCPPPPVARPERRPFRQQIARRCRSTSLCGSAADNTLLQNEDFWSSTGNPDPDSSESLLYRLAPPLCALHSVTIGVYRARYQFGCVSQGGRLYVNTWNVVRMRTLSEQQHRHLS